MSNKEEAQMSEEETKRLYTESFGWISKLLKRVHTARDLCEVVTLISNALSIEAIYRGAELGREDVFLLQMKEERKRRKERPSFYG